MEAVVALLIVGLVVAVGLTLYVVRGRGAAPGLEPPAEDADGAGAPAALLERPPEAQVTAEPRVEAPQEEVPTAPPVEAPVEELAPPEEEPPAKPTFRARLARARSSLAGAVGSILSRSAIDDQTWEELEEALIRADVGIESTVRILDDLREEVDEKRIVEPAQLLAALKQELKDQLGHGDLALRRAGSGPTVWLFVGVNGVGKTTTIGKLGRREADAGTSVVLAAGDTFRAAAAEQLQVWAERVGADFVRGSEGADPSSVIFDAIERAAARGDDLVLADTAGRLHTKVNLMEELRKVRRVADKGAGTVTEVLLVLDATTGQNGLVQARQFTEAVEVTGVVLTKLDGSAKGGIVLAIQQDLGIPVKLVGLGEGVDDLVEFDVEQFVEALFEGAKGEA